MKIKEIKIVNQDGSTKVADIGADVSNIDVSSEKTLKTKLNELDNQIENINNTTVNILPITMDKLGNEVKAALTGGSTPYVGLHSIGEEELKYDIPISYINNIKYNTNEVNFNDKTANKYWNLNSSTNKIELQSFDNLLAFDPIFLKGGKSYVTLQRCRKVFCWLLDGTYDSTTGAYDGTLTRISSTDTTDFLDIAVVHDSYLFITAYSNIGSYLNLVEKTSSSDNEIFNIISRGLLNFGEYIYTTDGLRLVNKNYVDNSITPDKVTFFNKTYNTDNYINPEKIIQNFVLSYTTGNVFPNNDWAITDFIIVEPGETLHWKQQPFGCQVCFYDENYNFISGNLIDNSTTITVPNDENIKFFVGSIAKKNINSSFLSRTATQYIPYSITYSLDDSIKIHINPQDTGLLQKFISKQLFNKDAATQGIYISYTTGQTVINSNYFETDYIETEANTPIALTSHAGGTQVCFYDETKTFISGILMQDGGSNNFTVPNNDDIKYFRINCTLIHLNDWAIMEGTSAYYEPYREYYKLKQEYLTNLFYVVDINGKGDFTSLTEAVSKVPTNSTIIVLPGLYENEKVKAWTKELYIIGVDRQNCIITNNTNNYSNPPIEMGPGILKNLTIWAQDGISTEQYTDYAVHVETNTLYNKKLTIENCTLHSANNAGLGMGMRGGCEVLLINSELHSDNTYGLFFHDSENIDYVGTQNFYLRNNLIWSSNGTNFMRMDSQCRDGSIINLEFINNTMRSLGSAKDNYTKRNARETTTTADDFLDLKNFRLKLTSYGNSHNSFNISRETN